MDGIAVSLPSSIKSPINSYARSPLVSVPSFNDPAKSHWEGVHSKIDTMTRVISAHEDMMASKHSNKAAAAASSASFWTAELNAHHHLSHAHNRTPIAAVTAPSPVKNEKYVPKPEKPIVLESECHVTHGRVYKKGGESVGLMGKQFKERYLALEGLILVFYDKKGGSRKDAFRITSDCEAMPNPAGKNKGIRFDFDLVNTESGDQRTIYCDSDSEMLNWVDTINYVVDCCAEANENAAENLRQKLQKSAESSAKSNAAIMDSQENVDRAYATIKANTLEVTNHTVRVHELQQIRKEAEKLHEADAGLAAAAANHAAPPDPFELEKLRDEAQCHSAYGTGLYEAFRGEPSTFVIQACDSSGDPKTLGGDSFLVTIESEEHSDVKWDITPLDNGDGTYFVEYTPTRVGEWSLHVMQFSTLRSGAVVQAEIYGSPFHPIVAKSPTSASHCIVVGAGKDMARLPPIVPSVGGNVFTITARDMFDEDRGIGGDQFQIDIDGPALANSILDRGDGTYEVSYDINEDSPAFVNAMKQASAGVSSPLFLTIHLKLNNPGFPYPRPVGLFSVKGLKVPVDLSSRFPEGTIAPPALVIQQPTTHHQSESAHLPSSLPLLPPQLPISHALLPPPPPLSLLPQATVHIPVSSTSSTNSSSPLASIEPAVSATTSVSPSQHHHQQQQQQPEEVIRLKAELAESERQMREALEAMAEERKALAEQKAEVERKMVQMQELSKKIMSDSERLAEQARAMRQAQVMAAAAAAASAASSSTAAPVGYSPSLAEKPYPSSASYASPPMQQQQQQQQQGLVSSSPVASSSTFPLQQQQQQQQQQQTKSPYIVSQEEPIQPFVQQQQQQQQRPIAAASSSSLGVTTTIAAPSSTTALSELFDPEIMSLFDKHKRALVALWSFYTAMSRGEDGTHSTPASGTDLKRFIELFMDFDIAPTFLTKREIKAIFAAASSAHNINGSDGLSTSPLTYAAFNEALGRAALVALSKPAFQSLYPTAKDKVGVLLEMWGVADPRKLREVQDKIAMEGSKGGSAASVAKSRASVSTSGRK